MIHKQNADGWVIEFTPKDFVDAVKDAPPDKVELVLHGTYERTTLKRVLDLGFHNTLLALASRVVRFRVIRDSGVDTSEDNTSSTPITTDPTKDPINPDHYKTRQKKGMEVVDVIEAFGLQDNWYRATAIKYLFRAGRKGPKVEDLKKAIWYIEREIKYHE